MAACVKSPHAITFLKLEARRRVFQVMDMVLRLWNARGVTQERWSAAATMSDAELHAWFRQEPAAAFAEVYRRHRSSVYGYLWHCRLPRAVCDDLSQEVFLRVNKALHHYEPTGSLKAWILTITVNMARSHWRKSEFKRQQPQAIEELVQATDTPDALAVSSFGELYSDVERLMAGLPEHERDALLLVAVEGLEHDEASRVLGIPVNTVKTHVRRARLKLRDRLVARGHDLAGILLSRRHGDE